MPAQITCAGDTSLVTLVKVHTMIHMAQVIQQSIVHTTHRETSKKWCLLSCGQEIKTYSPSKPMLHVICVVHIYINIF